ncbi:hypothetical protein UlMin_018312 [Ulmus minor]
MGSGGWFKTIIRLKKSKKGGPKRLKDLKSNAIKVNNNLGKGSSSLTNGNLDMPIEDIAATRIQTAFRAYKARKALRRLKGILRLQVLTQRYPVQKQSTTTLNHLHSWCKIQADVRARRLYMVTEGRIKQKKIENQHKLEAKIHDLEVEWNGGSETMDEILSRIYQREEASVKRERAMAYAFSHQWRANCSQSQGLGQDELGRASWGWSWKERWIAARPWESRVASQTISPKKPQTKQPNNVGKTPKTPKTPNTPKAPVSAKLPSSNGKQTAKARRLSFPSSEKPVANEESIKAQKANTKKEEVVS